MQTIYSIDNFLKEILNPDSAADSAYNGVQVECEGEVKKISFAVDASLSSIEEAVKNGSDLLIVHHGFFWGKHIPVTGIFKKRIKLLLENNIGLIAYHLPLDIHPEYGNNAEILRAITGGQPEITSFGAYHGTKIGYITELDTPLTINDIITKLEIKDNHYKILSFGNKNIKKIAVVSGGGDFAFDEAVKCKADLFITGDASHILFHPAKEYGLNVLFAGHYFTETFGVKALMRLIAGKMGIPASFIELPTDL